MVLYREWYEAVTEACVIDCIGWQDDDAKKSLQNLIQYETLMALDPKIGPTPALTSQQLAGQHAQLLAHIAQAAKDEQPLPLIVTEKLIETVIVTYLTNRVAAIQQHLQKTL
jgi:hypothetical protein